MVAAACVVGDRLTAPRVQVETLDEADQKIDKMAAEGQIDPAFLLTMAKAYSGVKESDMAQEEVRTCPGLSFP